MTIAVVVARLAVAALSLSGIIAQLVFTAGRGTLDPTRFFGYFTIQSNLIAIAALTLGAWWLARGRTQPQWLLTLRAGAATYMATTGVVFALLLRDSTVGADFNLAYADDVMHIWVPLAVIVDWVLVGDRPRYRWDRVWPILAFPTLWALLTLLRGTFIDGFYAYPFLHPEIAGGWGRVAVAVVCIAGFIGIVACAIVWLSRFRIIPVGDETRGAASRSATPAR